MEKGKCKYVYNMEEKTRRKGVDQLVLKYNLSGSNISCKQVVLLGLIHLCLITHLYLKCLG